MPRDHHSRLLLTALDGPSLGMCWVVVGTLVLGRDGDIAVADDALSRAHVELRTGHGAVRCRDLGSANGTRVERRGVRRRLGPRWVRVRPGAVLLVGGGRYRLDREPRPARATTWGRARLATLVVPLAMAGAMVPFAVGGPPWRWFTVLVPLAVVATALPRSREFEVVRRSRPAEILVASREGRAFHARPVVPNCLSALRSGDLAGTGWSFAGAAARSNAIWLAGFLAVHNDPDVLRVTSPWLTTHGRGLEVVFDPNPSSGPASTAAMVTWDTVRPALWAPVMRAPSWARASEAWIGALVSGAVAAGLPDRVDLADLVDTGVPGIAAGWARRPVDLKVPLGVGGAGPLVVDLAGDGPHALVAGMSGAGKSELLTSWLLALAVRNAPPLLHMILVDFKGGAAFDALRDLPHCVGVLTDLEEDETRRALESLRAQLRLRERRLREVGARDLSEYNARADEPLPVIVLVIDEYRALATDHPDLLDQFLRLANQGRSLGIHLIAATQRPGGSISPELRTNMPLRVCLRVAETADSLDMLSVPDAAGLESIPGRAILLRDGRSRVQVAWAGPHPQVAALVERMRGMWPADLPAPPWPPPLPGHVSAAVLAAGAFALADHPEELTQHVAPLRPEGLLVLGGAGTGRTAAAHTAARAALAEGDRVWLVSAAPAPAFDAAPPSFGGVIDPRQIRLVARLLDHAARPAPDRRTLVVDDVEMWIDTVDALHGTGAAGGALAVLLRSARCAGLRVVVAAQPASAHSRWAEPLQTRLHLSGTDHSTALLSGVPRDKLALLGGRTPGRGVLLPGATAVQIALTDTDVTVGGGAAAHRFVPLPQRGVAAGSPGRVLLGSDGEEAVGFPAVGDVVIIGPPGSGRTTTARLVAAQHPTAEVQDGQWAHTERPVIATTTPSAWNAAYSGPLARLRGGATTVLLRPDLFARLPGLDYAAELEPGGPGYGVLVHDGRARALRLARGLTPSGVGLVGEQEARAAVGGDERTRRRGGEQRECGD